MGIIVKPTREKWRQLLEENDVVMCMGRFTFYISYFNNMVYFWQPRPHGGTPYVTSTRWYEEGLHPHQHVINYLTFDELQELEGVDSMRRAVQEEGVNYVTFT